MDEDKKRLINYQLNALDEIIDQLRELLPKEQLNFGSELQQIDALNKVLGHKYVLEDYED